jgi:hypothetical protein
MRSPAIASYKQLRLILIAAFGLAQVAPVVGQDKLVLGPRQFQTDTSGAGAVLCVWSIYLSVQAQTAACSLPRRPVDDAIDQAIAAIDDFILANSSLHPTKAMVDAFKHDVAASEVSGARRFKPDFCKGPDLEHFRSPAPEQIQASVKALLAIPREPVMNPCL